MTETQEYTVKTLQRLLAAAQSGHLTLTDFPELQANLETAARQQAQQGVADYFNQHEPYKADREWVHKHAKYAGDKAAEIQKMTTNLDHAHNTAVQAINDAGDIEKSRLLKAVRHNEFWFGVGLSFGTLLALSCLYMLFKIFF